MNRDVHFNCIYVIQSLKDNEKQTGTHLMNDTIKRWAEYRFENLKAELIDLTTKVEFINALLRLRDSFHEKQLVPYIHFEIHGCKEGLVLKNGELVSWYELRPLLVDINYYIENNLFVSLATCFGAYIFNAVDVLDRIPFYAFVGAPTELYEHEIESDWTSYFDVLLTTRDINEAIIALNRSNNRVIYAFFTSEQIFDIVTKSYLEKYQGRKAKRERFNSLLRRAKRMPGIKERYSDAELTQYFKDYVNSQPAIVQQMKDYFLMKADKLPFQL